jgi:hypothetical protein
VLKVVEQFHIHMEGGAVMANAAASWFEVDKEGLAAQLERRSKSFILFELIQNAIDEETELVTVTLENSEFRGYQRLVVTDDSPEGFKDLKHAWTMFARSPKGSNPEKRGRFDIGEKLVLSLCKTACISSTKGTVTFDANGRRRTNRRQERGTIVEMIVRMTTVEAMEALKDVHSILVPAGVRLIVNGTVIEHRKPVDGFTEKLQTEIADADGLLRRSERFGRIDVYEVRDGEKATIYEMGIPIDELGDDRWHYDIGQRVPLSTDRDSVNASFLKRVRTHVLNHCHSLLTSQEDASASWAREAAGDKDVTPEAVERVSKLRFGDKRVAFDPSDPEANRIAVSKGYTVVHGGSLTGDEWANVRSSGAVLPAGQVTPSPKPFDPEGNPLKLWDEDLWDDGTRYVVEFAKALGRQLLGHSIHVDVTNDIGWGHAAAYGGGHLTLNRGRLGKRWFLTGRIRPQQTNLILHEYAHEGGVDHLDARYHEACTRLAGELVELVATDQSFREKWYSA